MASVVQSVQPGAAQPEDPWDWTIDQVVDAICYLRSPPLDDIPITGSAVSNPAVFEQALRRNEVGGECLLNGLDLATLRDDLGLASLAQRVFVVQLVKDLRRKSQRYINQLHLEQSLLLPNAQPPQAASRVVRWVDQQSAVHGAGPSAFNVQTGAGQSMVPISIAPEELPTPSPLLIKSPDDHSELPASSNVQIFVDESGKKKKKLNLSALVTVPAANSNSLKMGNLSPDVTILVDESGKKKKKLNLSALVAVPAANSSSLDMGVLPVDQTDRPENANSDTADGTNTHAVQIAMPNHSPETQVPITARSQNAINIVARRGRPTRTPNQMYSGFKGIRYDSILYGETKRGQELNIDAQYEDSEFEKDQKPGSFWVVAGVRVCQGQRLYIHDRFKHFVQQDLTPIVYKDEILWAILPYPIMAIMCARKHWRPSMTIFRQSSKGQPWSAFRVERPLPEELKGLFSTVGQQSRDREDPDNLKKWINVPGGDEEVDLENLTDNDEETAIQIHKEIIKERRDRSQKPKKLIRSKGTILSQMKVMEILNNAIETFVKSWKAKQAKHPSKVQRKAWRLWQRALRQGSKDAFINELTDRFMHLRSRLSKIWDEIVKVDWTVERKLIVQSRSMQPTIVEQETTKWQMEVLKCPTAPEKPPPAEPKKPKSAKQALSGKAKKIADQELHRYRKGGNAEEDDDASDSSHMSDFVVDDEVDVPEAQTAPKSLLMGAGVVNQKVNPNWPVFTGKGPLRPLFPNWGKKRQLLEAQEAAKRKAAEEKTTEQKEAEEKTAEQKTAEEQITKQQVEGGNAPNPTIQDTADWMPSAEANSQAINLKRGNTSPQGQNKKQKLDTASSEAPDVLDLARSESSVAKHALSMSDPDLLPAYDQVDMIHRMDPKKLIQTRDRKRLLIWTLSRVPKAYHQSTISAYDDTPFPKMRATLIDALRAIECMPGLKPGMKNVAGLSYKPYMMIASWWITWSVLVNLNQDSGIQIRHIRHTRNQQSGFKDFYYFLGECLAHWRDTPIEIDGLSTKQSLMSNPSDNNDISVHPEDNNSSLYTKPQWRKRKVIRNEAAKDTRAHAQASKPKSQMQKEAIEREKRAKSALRAMGVNDEDPSKAVINISKEDDHDFIYINPHIGTRIQPHQIAGVQFMWKALTTNHHDLQGCLLSHTMGLGKTMQVITLMVSMAEAAKSTDKKISHQIPAALRQSQSLVLCPPALLNNWNDEFDIWAPDRHYGPWRPGTIGEIFLVSAALNTSERKGKVQQWALYGGVLLLGYTTFRDLLTRKKNGTMTEEEYDEVVDWLLQKPNLIVADEAHNFKNQNSLLWKAMTRFRSKSRVALTGSPLSNSLDEYFTIIDWIAPNYLGSLTEFKAYYMEPIKNGLYLESTDEEYLESLKYQKALQFDLEPKVHRAGVSVLQNKLKGKTEFLISLPITKFQAQIYTAYVDYISSVKPEDTTTTTLIGWLADLLILCNHPQCFERKLQGRLRDRANKKSPEAQSGIINSDDESEEATSDSNIPETMTKKLLEMFDTIAEPLNSLALSFKMQVLKQILDLGEALGDKTLVFSHSILTLDYIESMLRDANKTFIRVDGATKTMDRQALTKGFNERNDAKVCLISTKAGGIGLNMAGANRVVILDTHFSPMHEEQAIGRAYRLGQTKTVYVYRLMLGGTFEEAMFNQSLFKQQLATRVVDKKNPVRNAQKSVKQYVFRPRPSGRKDLSSHIGEDPGVLDRLVVEGKSDILSIKLTETFHQEDTKKLTAEQEKEAQRLQAGAKARRRETSAFDALQKKREQKALGVST